MLVKLFLSCIDTEQHLFRVDRYRVKPWCFSAMPGGMWMVMCPHTEKTSENSSPYC